MAVFCNDVGWALPGCSHPSKELISSLLMSEDEPWFFSALEYKPPFQFTGDLKRLRVGLSGEPSEEQVARFKARIVRQ